MAKPSSHRDAVSIVIPIFNASERLDAVLPAWADLFARYGREFEILAVNDGCTDGTGATLDRLAARVKSMRVLRHEKRMGFGACLRTALAQARHPLLFYTGLDYPYTPSDIRPMLDRIEVRDLVIGRQPDLISGCRTGRRAPLAIRFCGRAWRLFWRIVAGMELHPSPTWLGWREWLTGGLLGWVFGVPLADVNSAFKLYRTAFLRRVPIQSNGDFVHVELVAKATFLTSIMDEIALTPKPDPIPRTSWYGLWTVLTNAEFTVPPTVNSDSVAPAVPPPVPIS